MRNKAPKRVDGKLVVASISGGKDSAALSLHLRDLGIEHTRVFCDTGWEHPATYDYLRGELTRVIGPIVELRSTLTFSEWSEKKGMFPSRLKRWCTEKLKLDPLKAHFAELDGDALNVVGIRGDESAARAAMPEWEWSEGLDVEVWRPLLRWSMQDVVDIHKRHGLAPNPLYLKGASRVGCWPCINAGRGELRLVNRIDPGRIDQIRELEKRVNARAAEIVGARGEQLISPRSLLRERAAGMPAGIDGQIEWALRDGPMKSDDAGGCMRWGMCETSKEDD